MLIKLGKAHSRDGLGNRRWSFPANGKTVKVFDRGANCPSWAIPEAQRFLVELYDGHGWGRDAFLESEMVATKPQAEQVANELAAYGKE